ncbi:MAG: ABC transporter permease [Pseudomonadota bacterium]
MSKEIRTARSLQEEKGNTLEELRKASLPSFYDRYIKIQLYRLLLLAFFLAVWQIVSGRLIPANWIASPLLVFQKAWEWVSSGILFYHLRATVLEMIIGSVIGTFLAILTGFILGSNRLLSDALMPYIAAIYGIPRIAMAPLFIMWFGIGTGSKVVLVTVVVYFLVFFNAFVGARDVDKTYINTIRIMGASRWNIFRKVVFPHSAGWIFVGLRLALPRALIAAVVGEIISSNQGLGYLIEESGGMFDVAGILVAVGVLAILGVLLNSLVNRMEVMTNRYRFIE